MKDEEEKMHEYIKDFTNAHSTIKKVEGIDGTFRTIKISVKTFLIIGTIVAIIMIIPIVAMVVDKASIVFTMDKEGYITTIEKNYRQRIEIVEDNSTKKGNGVILFKTEREPIVEFKSVKTIAGGVESYYIEYEGKALKYYIENGEEEIFKEIEIVEIPRSITINMFKSEEILEFEAYLPIESYSQLEDGVRQLIELRKFMQKKIRTFEIPLHIKIGEYIGGYDYKEMKAEEEIIYQEKQNYYWYLKNKGEDVNFIPEEDLLKIDRPQTLDVYVNGERLVNKKQTEMEKYYAEQDGREYKTVYIVANYNQEEKCYETDIDDIVRNCDKFQILDDGTSGLSARIKFSYQNREYEVHWRDRKVHGKKLPYGGNIEFLEQVLKIKLEYDYQNKKVNLIIP